MVIIYGYHIPQPKNIAIPPMTFSAHNFTILPTFHMEFFRIDNPIYFFFFEIDRNYMSIIITIISNIDVLMSHNIIFFGFFVSMSHSVHKKTPPSAFSHLLPPHQVFTRFHYHEITNQKLLLFFRFPSKLSLRLILLP